MRRDYNITASTQSGDITFDIAMIADGADERGAARWICIVTSNMDQVFDMTGFHIHDEYNLCDVYKAYQDSLYSFLMAWFTADGHQKNRQLLAGIEGILRSIEQFDWTGLGDGNEEHIDLSTGNQPSEQEANYAPRMS